ncbi:MAG: LamG domain-containing protein [Calditrichaeota bacterium]|nr:MAG: LamG domain-containing protein [Calditrichota bacterium]MBL1205349.1 LamG domain-containing protein [Calditrichota bacterium]NOG45178.1 LamG domain-containing protein [Calditrichota bacterium]
MIRLRIVLSFMLIIAWSCENNSPLNNDSQKPGDVSLSIDMTLAPTKVSGLKGLLERDGFESISFEFIITDNQAVAEVENIVHGEWELSVHAVDEDGNIIYQGSTKVNINPGEVTTVHLHLDTTTGNLKIIVTWGDWPTRPVAYYPFNSSASDKSGNENHGEVIGAILTEDRLGKPNSAYAFDGFDDYIDIGNNPILKPQFPIAVSTWINIKSFEDHNPIFTNNFDDGEYFGIWFYALSTKRVSLMFGNGGPAGPYSRRGYYTKDEVLKTNEWIHVVGIMRSPDDMDIYIDGNKAELIESTGLSDSTSLVYNNNPASIGRGDGTITVGNTNYFHGKIDELYIFNTTLSQNMIDKLLNSNN